MLMALTVIKSASYEAIRYRNGLPSQAFQWRRRFPKH